MPVSLKVVSAAALCMIAVAGTTAAWGQSAPVTGGPSVSCFLMGYDLVVINQDAKPLPVGTVVKWSVKDMRMSGQHAMEDELVPGVGKYLIGELKNYVWEKTCTAEVVLPPAGSPAAPARTQ